MKQHTKKMQPVMIGVFVSLSIFIFMTGIVLFAGSRFFNKDNLVIAYFDDSLKGLSVGAPVTYMGVTVGQVKEIKIQIKERGPREHNVIIPVIIAFDTNPEMVITGAEFNSVQGVDAFIESMIKQGLRAKLKTISLVTGKRYIDLALYNNTIAMYQDQRGKYLEIPTLPSDIHQMQKVLGDMDLGRLYHKVLSTFESLDTLAKSLSQALSHEKTQTLVDDLVAASENLNAILGKIDSGMDPILKKVNRELDDISALTLNANTVITTLDQHIQPVAASFTKTLDNLDNTLLQANQLLNQAEQTLQPSSPLYHRLSETLRQLETTSSSIKQLSDFISRNPDALIFGLQQTGEINEQK